MVYDTHCHPLLASQKSQDTILENFFAWWGVYLNTISTNLEDSKRNIELTKKYPGIFASVGIHPTDTLEYVQDIPWALSFLKKLIQENKEYIVAIGECGLDYYWIETLSEKYKRSSEDIKKIQKDFFEAHIDLAKELGLPLVIHNRESGEDLFEILQKKDFRNFIFHCFTENLDYARKLIAFAPDCKLGFGGILTFKSAESLRKVVREIPLGNIIIETDSPYLTPVPYRGREENEPLYVQYVLQEIQKVRSENPEEIQQVIFQSSIDFFRVKK